MDRLRAAFGPPRPNPLLHQTQAVGRNVAQESPGGPPPVQMYHNAVYYPNYKVYQHQPPSSLKLDIISHVFYAFAWLVQSHLTILIISLS